MLEFVFFDPRPRDGFVRFAREQGVIPVLEQDDELLKVLLPEDLDDAVSEALEDCYDDMMSLNRTLFENEGGAEAKGFHEAGITVQLKDGRYTYAKVDPFLLGRIMEVLSPQEFNDVVNAIADAVENPDERSMCERIRDQQG